MGKRGVLVIPVSSSFRTLLKAQMWLEGEKNQGSGIGWRICSKRHGSVVKHTVVELFNPRNPAHRKIIATGKNHVWSVYSSTLSEK